MKSQSQLIASRYASRVYNSCDEIFSHRASNHVPYRVDAVERYDTFACSAHQRTI